MVPIYLAAIEMGSARTFQNLSSEIKNAREALAKRAQEEEGYEGQRLQRFKKLYKACACDV